MASFTEALRLVIDADTRGAIAEVNRFGDATARALSKSETSLDRWGSRLSTVGVGMIGFGAAAIAGLGMAAKSAGELEQAVGGTEAVFKDASGEIDRFAKNSADKLGLSERAFRELTTVSGAMLKNLGLDTKEAAKQAVKLTEVGADLAATYGGTTKEAVEALGAALRGEADPAERFGLRLSQSAVNAKAVEMGLAESESAVDDYAKAQATLALIMEQSADAQGRFSDESDTLQGRQQRLAASFEDLKAAIGEGALPVFEGFADIAQKSVGIFSSLDDATGGVVGQLATFGAVGLIAVGALSTIIGKLIEARAGFAAAKVAAAEFGITLKSVAVGGAVIGGLVAIRTVLGTINDELDRADMSKLENQLLRLGQTGTVTGDVLDKTLNKIFEGGGPEGLVKGRQAVKDLDDALASLAARDPKAAAAAFDVIVEKAKEAGLSTGQVKAGFDDYTAAVTDADTANRSASGAIDETTGEIDGQTEATKGATEAVQSYSDALRGLFDPLFGAVNAQQQLADANADVIGKEMELAAAIEEHGANSLEAMAATDALRQAQLDAAAAAVGQEAALSQLKDAVVNEGLSVDDAKAKLAQWVAQGLITQESADVTAAKFDELATSAEGVPDSVNTYVSTTGIQQVNTDVANLKAQLDAIPRSKNVEIITTFKSFFSGEHRQHGGPVRAGEAYIVGERQAELFVPDQNGTILPGLPQSMGIAGPGGGGGGGGGVVTLVIDSGSNPADQVLLDMLRRSIRIQHGGNVQAAIGFKR